MAIEPTLPAEPIEPFQPSLEQRERREQQRRFTRRWVYVPVGLLFFLWLAVTIVLLWLTLAGESVGDYRVAISGVADLVLILFMTPLVLLCAIPAFGPIGLYVYLRRQRDPEVPGWMAKLRRLFWRLENVVVNVRETLDEKVLPKLAEPVVSAYAIAAFVRTLFKELKTAIRREINRYG